MPCDGGLGMGDTGSPITRCHCKIPQGHRVALLPSWPRPGVCNRWKKPCVRGPHVPDLYRRGRPQEGLLSLWLNILHKGCTLSVQPGLSEGSGTAGGPKNRRSHPGVMGHKNTAQAPWLWVEKGFRQP